MSLKNTISSFLGDSKEYRELLYIASKIVFLGCTLLFFTCYFCISANFYAEFLLQFFLGIYIAFVLSFTLFLGAFTWRFGFQKIPQGILMLISIVLAILAIVFILPVF